jgi:Arc/MetJ-type ribon-helix-helix transcriptional regulator
MDQLEDVKQVTVRLPTTVKEYLDREVARNRSSQSSEVIRLLRDRMAREARDQAAR